MEGELPGNSKIPFRIEASGDQEPALLGADHTETLQEISDLMPFSRRLGSHSHTCVQSNLYFH